MARFIKKNTIPLNVIAKQALYEALSFGSPGAMNSQFGQKQSKSKDLETSPIQFPVSGSGDVRRPEEPLGTKPVEQPDSENNPNSPNYRPPTVEGEKTGGAGLGQETFGTKDPDQKKKLEAKRAQIDAEEDAKMQQQLSKDQYTLWKVRKQFADQAKNDPNSDIARRSKAAASQRAGNLAAEKTQQDTNLTRNQKTLITRSQRSSGRGILADLQQKAQREAEST